MQFLYQERMLLFTMITHCVTQRTQFNGMETLFTLDVSQSEDSYPFCVWPANITATDCDESVSLLCVIQDCHLGPSIVVGDQVFTSSTKPKIASSCVPKPDSHLDGTWVVHLTLAISDVAQRWNRSGPIPMHCNTTNYRSEIAYLSIPTRCSDPVTMTTTSSAIIPTLTSNSIRTTISPPPTSALLISSTLAPLSSTISTAVSHTTQNSAYGKKKISLMFTLIISFVPLLLNCILTIFSC